MRAANKIAGAYAAVGVLWILFSDSLVSRLASPALVLQIGVVKGWAFVAITATLLHILVRHSFARLSETRARLKLAVGIARIGFFEWDVRTNEVYLSPEWWQQLGYDAGEMGSGFDEWASRLHPDDREWMLATQHRFRLEPWLDYQAEFRLRHRDGSYRWILAQEIALRDEKDEVCKIVGTHLDITERKEVEARIRYASQHDELTDLPSRSLAYELASDVLADASTRGGRAVVMLADVDRFKTINHAYGQDVGNAVLKEAAARVASSVQSMHTVGRFGGDVFLVVQSLPEGLGADQAAAAVRQAMQAPFRAHGIELDLSVTLGVAVFPRDGRDIEVLARHADAALRHAKENRSSGFLIFTQQMDQEEDEARLIESRLRGAIERGDFEMHYQPLVSTVTGKVAGVEALMRWPRGNEHGFGPDKFIRVAESCGLIGDLGRWSLEQACRQQVRWQRQGLPVLSVAVNFSPLQVGQRDILAVISEIIRTTGVAPGCLEMEVTEGALMKDVDEAVRLLAQFKALGVKIVLDDFGTGYSSLSYLTRLPIDKLKVDKSFVRHLWCDEGSRAVTEAIIALARSLRLQVVAEGIETPEALHVLRQLGCDQAQGYLVSRPMPPDRFVDWYLKAA